MINKTSPKIGKIKVIKERCIAALPCTVVAPNVFKINEENKAYVADPKGADDATILAAAQSCPVNAIILEDEHGNQIYP